ncbi:SWIM zinc finger family protein [Prescottella agglutinans]|uniref:Zn finger protein n=1 Tax=Prescottella agglutinans TaxID=1644129 RepID=A0ABT6MCL8_9NOCA|nr:SWIM zinc finger family protein [Prescottella agglutinans]MDH6281496.1 putative Zn finger protein [Prescottella agglutinans]
MSPQRGGPDFSAFGKRRPVVGGVEAASKRGAFARGWWGRALIDSLERVGDSGRLSRGRTYARGGQVIALDIAAGRVTGEVQGSQIAPFTAVLTLGTLDEEHTAELVEKIRSTPGTLAALAAGAVPQELAPMLLPDGGRELDFDCTCPDPGWPCKHVAAVAYLLAERVDRDPITMLTVRGLHLDMLMSAVGGEDEDESNGAADGDHFGDDVRYAQLPEIDFAAAPDDLDATLLRKVLRAGVEEEPDVAAALRDLDECYRALGSGFRRRR